MSNIFALQVSLVGWSTQKFQKLHLLWCSVDLLTFIEIKGRLFHFRNSRNFGIFLCEKRTESTKPGLLSYSSHFWVWLPHTKSIKVIEVFGLSQSIRRCNRNLLISLHPSFIHSIFKFWTTWYHLYMASPQLLTPSFLIQISFLRTAMGSFQTSFPLRLWTEAEVLPFTAALQHSWPSNSYLSNVFTVIRFPRPIQHYIPVMQPQN